MGMTQGGQAPVPPPEPNESNDPNGPTSRSAMDRDNASDLGGSRRPAQAVVILGDKAFVVQFDLCTFCDVCESFCLECADGRSFVVVFAQDQTANATHEHQQADDAPGN
jgi:hypothetical protein